MVVHLFIFLLARVLLVSAKASIHLSFHLSLRAYRLSLLRPRQTHNPPAIPTVPTPTGMTRTARLLQYAARVAPGMLLLGDLIVLEKLTKIPGLL